jgi:lantibiotic modifying enzyme
VSAAVETEQPPPLEVAQGIAFGIARRALWHEDRCAWFDAVPPMSLGANPAVSVAGGFDVYGGSAGIGLFLAQAAARTGDGTLRRTARGALLQALSRCEREPKAPKLGFYGGNAGSAAAAVLAGRELGDDELVSRGLALLRLAPLVTNDPMASDLVAGTAGTLLALVVAARSSGDDALLARGREAARMLIGIGRRGPGGTLSWNTMPDALGDLTGFAHGSAGNAYALLVLHAVVPDDALAGAVRGALAYEASTYSTQHGNWPDLRWFGGPRTASYTNAWCHGAIGIVRARLLAERLGFPVRADVDAALRTVATHVEVILGDPSFDTTLCHGLFGAVDALLDGVRAGRTEYEPLIARAVAQTTERHHVNDWPWPSGLLSREQIDGLMMGTAGIGHVFLRLADPSLESVLAPAGAPSG